MSIRKYINVREFSDNKKKRVQDALFKMGYTWLWDKNEEYPHLDKNYYFFGGGEDINQDAFIPNGNYEEITYEKLMRRAGMSKFNKEDLKEGDKVYNTGTSYPVIVLDNDTILVHQSPYGGSYRTHTIGFLDNNITKVMRQGEVVYEKEITEEMTLEEVCKALGKNVKIVKDK